MKIFTIESGLKHMSTTFQLNPDRVAFYEAEGWRAYYDHKWIKMLRLIVSLAHEQFHIPFPMSLLAGYYTTRASAAWVPEDHDEQKVLHYLQKFYQVARCYSGLKFDTSHVADLELRYFDVHRRLAGNPEKEEFLQTLIELHCAIFGISPEQAQESAEWRLLAATTVDLITSHTSTDVEGDWTKLEEYLRRCYRSIQQEIEEQQARQAIHTS